MHRLLKSIFHTDYIFLIQNYNPANGGIGVNKMELETFVQLNYFDRILAKANKRLMEMTSGQYPKHLC